MKKRTENKDGTSGKHRKVFDFKYTLLRKQVGDKGGGSLPEVHDFLLDQQVLRGPIEENKNASWSNRVVNIKHNCFQSVKCLK